jgi:hypothetical protein
LEETGHGFDVVVVAPAEFESELAPGVEVGHGVEGRGCVVNAPALVEFASGRQGVDHCAEDRLPEPHPVPLESTGRPTEIATDSDDQADVEPATLDFAVGGPVSSRLA